MKEQKEAAKKEPAKKEQIKKEPAKKEPAKKEAAKKGQNRPRPKNKTKKPAVPAAEQPLKSAKRGADAALKEQILQMLERRDYRPQSLEDLGGALQVVDYQAYLQAIKELSEDYLIAKTKKGRYVTGQRAGLLRGVYLARGRDFGFVHLEDENEDDVFVGSRHSKGVMDGDEVIFTILAKNGHSRNFDSREGQVLKIVQHANTRVVGALEQKRDFAYLYPDNKRLYQPILIPLKQLNGAKTGEKAVAEITAWATAGGVATGKIVHVLGAADAAGVDMDCVLWQYDLREDFPAAVQKLANSRAQEITPADLVGRIDLRELPIVTIDGADAKDLDDGVFCRKTEQGWHLSVHIADVTHYVQGGDELDKEAFARGTSTYLPDRVIPMLPRSLSNGMCSLNAGVDRLALSCAMELDATGKVLSYDIFESVIRVAQRLTYSLVNAALLDNEAAAQQELAASLPMLRELAALQQVLEQARNQRGSLGFDFPETKIIMDEKNEKVLDIVKRNSRLAEKMVEEAMIITNEVVAREYHRRQIPFIYRVHQAPTPQKRALLNEVLEPLGYGIDAAQDLTPQAASAILRKVAGKPEDGLVQVVLLRSMSHAFYSIEALGHFGLASKYYSHFTSPIRRYADLSIHRVIKTWLHQGLETQDKAELAGVLALAALQASERERVAEEAERKAVKMKCCQFMADKVGTVFAGVISGVQPYGIYVELDNSVEGLVHTSNMPAKRYDYLAASYMLRGDDGARFRLGDSVKIEVLAVNLDDQLIDFRLTD